MPGIATEFSVFQFVCQSLDDAMLVLEMRKQILILHHTVCVSFALSRCGDRPVLKPQAVKNGFAIGLNHESLRFLFVIWPLHQPKGSF